MNHFLTLLGSKMFFKMFQSASEHLGEVMNAPTEAVRIGRKAFEDAVREIDNLGEEGAKEIRF